MGRHRREGRGHPRAAVMGRQEARSSRSRLPASATCRSSHRYSPTSPRRAQRAPGRAIRTASCWARRDGNLWAITACADARLSDSQLPASSASPSTRHGDDVPWLRRLRRPRSLHSGIGIARPSRSRPAPSAVELDIGNWTPIVVGPLRGPGGAAWWGGRLTGPGGTRRSATWLMGAMGAAAR